MTEQDLRLLDYIREQIAETGLAPTYAEMAAAIGRKSRARMHERVDRLIRAGQLIRKPGIPRGLQLPNDVNIAGIPTDRLEAELRRRRRAPMWSRDFLALPDAEPPIGMFSPRRRAIGGARG